MTNKQINKYTNKQILNEHSVRSFVYWPIGLFVYWSICLLVYLFIGLFLAPSVFASLKTCAAQIENPNEPHPLRPNPGKDCTEDPANRDVDPGGRLTCGNDLVAVKTISMPRGGKGCTPSNPAPGEQVTCTADVSLSVPISIGLSDLELPVAGVASNTSVSDALSSAGKMSQYTSWYLQGDAEGGADLAAALAAYMNSIIELTKGTSGLKLLSPAFNITDAATPPLFTGMEAAGANFAGLDGFAGNTYTISGRNAYDWYADFLKGKVSQYGKSMIFTEFGDLSLAGTAPDSRPAIVQKMSQEFSRTSGDSSVAGILYFNAFGANSGFSDHRLSDNELSAITAASLRSAGVNNASGPDPSGAFAAHVSSIGLGWSLEIAFSPSDKDSVISSFNAALARGLTPILRICAGSDCAFKDPHVYASFLKEVANGLTEGDRTFWAIAGPNEPELEPWVTEKTVEDDSELLFSGPLKKLLPKQIIDEKREELIRAALSGTTYNQIIGYVKDNEILSRKDSTKFFAENPGRGDIQKIRLTDMASHLAPPYRPGDDEAMKWYALWREMPFVQTVDLPGEVFATLSQADPSMKNAKLTLAATLSDFRVSFPHLSEVDQLSQLLQSVFRPQEVLETTGFQESRAVDYTPLVRRAPYDTQYCNLETSFTNPGDTLEAKRTVNGEFSFTKTATYSYRELTTAERQELLKKGEPIPTTVDAQVSGPLSVFVRNPLEMENIYDRLVGGPGSIWRSIFPVNEAIQDYPATTKISYGCGPGCEVWPGNQRGRQAELYFPHWGTILQTFHQKLQAALNPLTKAVASLIPRRSGPPGAVIGQFQLTYYWLTNEHEFSGPANTEIFDRACQALAKVPNAFAQSLTQEGSGKLNDGRILNYDGSCSCGFSPCFAALGSQFPWGQVASGGPAVPFRSIAVDTNVIPLGKRLYIRELDTIQMPGDQPWGGFLHDGCVVAEDTGSAIIGKHIDFFSALKEYYRVLGSRLPASITLQDGGVRCQ